MSARSLPRLWPTSEVAETAKAWPVMNVRERMFMQTWWQASITVPRLATVLA